MKMRNKYIIGPKKLRPKLKEVKNLESVESMTHKKQQK